MYFAVTARTMPAQWTAGMRRFYATVGSLNKITLNALADNPGAVKRVKRVGRGSSSGKGKTCGRGQKGQKARSGNGKPRLNFEGGQTPISKRFPKRGFTNIHARTYNVVNLDKLQQWIDMGRLDPHKKITMKELNDSGCVNVKGDGVQLLAGGVEQLRTPIDIEVSRASTQAIKAVESIGGRICCVYHNPLGLRALLHPEKFITLPKQAMPTKKRDKEWYSDIKHRGYLASIPEKLAVEQMETTA
ncbi:ribosomal protein L18e/L15P [Syncephalis plumigaleata]|nr:ribosomal protein L18e/L15P [Syncephalis plumigaleata]